MLRKMVCAGFVMAVVIGLATADEFTARITKVEGNNVTFTKAKKGEKGEEMTLPAAKDVRVTSGGKKGEEGKAVEGGLQAKQLQNIGEKGVFARIVTDDDNKEIKEIRLFQFGGFQKKKRPATDN